MNEEWKYIPNTNDGYQVSTKGNVRGVDRKGLDGRKIKGQNLKFYVGNHGYRCVDLRVDGKYQKKLIHRLVAETFLDTFLKGLDVNHIDGNKQNNRLNNLEMVTRSENIKHAFKLGLSKVSQKNIDRFAAENKKRMSKQVVQKELDGTVVKRYSSMREASLAITGNVHGGSLIGRVASGKHKQAYGYLWEWYS